MNDLDLEKLVKTSKQYFEITLIEDGIDKWDECLAKTVHLSVDYSYWFITYQNAYFRDIYDNYKDFSLLINCGGVLLLWPMCMYTNKDNETVIGSNGGELLPPAIIQNLLHAEAERKLYTKCLNFLKDLCRVYNINKIMLQSVVFSSGLSQWDRKLLETGFKIVNQTCEAYLDLEQTEEQILKNIRRTNKYSIVKGMKQWGVHIISRIDSPEVIEKEFSKFEQLHLEVSGRKTRDAITWKIQAESIKNSNDFLVVMYDDSGNMIGSSLFQTSGGFGIYSVGAYKRELFNQPIAHVSQWYAILHMKKLGIKWYYIGRRSYAMDQDNPTEKELSISHFKEGFSTNLFIKIHYELILMNLG